MRRLVVAFILLFAGLAFARNDGLFRYPDVCGSKVVFTHAGDLWMVSTKGGMAWRLTSHPGLELSPKFSRDCTKIAFTAQYDGNFNVYVMNADGTGLHQVTYSGDVGDVPERFGPNNMVLDWTPDGKIVFFSRKDTFNIWFGKLYTVSPDGGYPTQIPVPKGGLVSFAPEGSRMAYNRIFRNFRTWKHYTGGMAQDIWIYDLKEKHTTHATNFPGTETFPVWIGNKIYFSSDNNGQDKMNIYSYDYSTHEIKKLTNFKDFDCLWLSGKHPGPYIAFQHGLDLYLLDTRNNKVRKLDIYLPGDRPFIQPKEVDASKYIEDVDISPHGNRVVFTARGDIFTVPHFKGDTRDLTNSSGAHDRYAAWSPDGKWIAFISDQSGEDELYIAPADGSKKPIRLTFDGHCKKYQPVWSPDSKKIAWSDKDDKLYWIDIKEKKVHYIDKSEYWEIRQYTWSWDSNYIAYQKIEDNMFGRIYVYSLKDKQIYPVSSYYTNDSLPAFDPDGRYLYFVSQLQLNPALSDFEMSFIYQKTARVVGVTLRKDVKAPGIAKVQEAKPANKKKTRKGKKSKKHTKNFKIDFDGIQTRIFELPGEGDNIVAMYAAKDMVVYLATPVQGLEEPYPGEKNSVHIISIPYFKNYKVLEGPNNMVVSWGLDKALLINHGQYYITNLPRVSGYKTKPKMSMGDVVDTSGMKMIIDPKKEWREAFEEAWRLERDFFYSPIYNHKDGLAFWKKVRATYEAWLPYIQHRYDLNFVIGEMIGELANSHTYVGGGDYPKIKKVAYGVLGVDWEVDAKSKRYRIKRILPGENWREGFVSPLTEPGLGVKAGDYVLAINGTDLMAPDVPGRLLRGTVGRTIRLTINSKPTYKGARTIWVKPVASEINLRHLAWIQQNMDRVSKMSNNKIGYIYIPDMETFGLNEFVRQYFPQIRKQALIIDVRYNGGGFVDEMIFERLRRILVGMMSSRNSKPYTVPDQVFVGPMACVTNHYAASDGDFFSYFFKKYHLGKLIGTRTWGGVRGIRGYTYLIDRGYITQPEFALYSVHSKWLIENHGVEPDIVVDNLPEQVMAGHDPQLEKAVNLLMDQIKKNPPKLPPVPAWWPPYPQHGEE